VETQEQTAAAALSVLTTMSTEPLERPRSRRSTSRLSPCPGNVLGDLGARRG